MKIAIAIGRLALITGAVVGVACVIAAAVLLHRAGERHDQLTLVERELQQYAGVESELATVRMAGELPSVWESWNQLEDLAALYGVRFEAAPGNVEKPMAVRVQSWEGLLTGNARDVLVLATGAQQVMPLYFGSFALKDGKMTLVVSVLGKTK